MLRDDLVSVASGDKYGFENTRPERPPGWPGDTEIAHSACLKWSSSSVGGDVVPRLTFTIDCLDLEPLANFWSAAPGPPNERFIYLSWGTVDGDGTFNMFRRAKVWLNAIDAAVLGAARKSGHLVARRGLTDAKGHPLRASVRPPVVQWSAA